MKPRFVELFLVVDWPSDVILYKFIFKLLDFKFLKIQFIKV